MKAVADASTAVAIVDAVVVFVVEYTRDLFKSLNIIHEIMIYITLCSLYTQI